MSKVKRLGKNTLLVFMGNFGSKVIGLLMMPFYTKWLSVEDYGVTDLIHVYVSFIIGFVTCCIAESLFIFPKNKPQEEQTQYLSSALVFCFTTSSITALLFALIQFASNTFSIYNSFTNYLWLVYFMMISQIFQTLTQQFTRSIDKMLVYSITGIVATVTSIGYSFALVPKYGVNGYVISMILSNLSAAIYSFGASKSFLFFDIKSFKVGVTKKMLKYSIPLIPNSIMWWVVNALNRPIMENSVGMHDIGIYAVANRFPGILSMVFAVFATSWQISVLEEFGNKTYSKFYNQIFRVIFSVLIVVLLCLTIGSKIIIRFFADPEFFEAWKYVPLLTLSVFFSNISGFAGANFSATRESKYYFYSSLWGAATALLLNFILIPMIGIWGACISVIFSFIIMSISRIAYSWKYVHLENIISYVGILLLIMFLMCLVIYECNIFLVVVNCILVMVSLFVLVNKDVSAVLELLKKRIR